MPLNDDLLGPLSATSVFDLYPDGAAIIGGGSNKVQKSRKLGWLQRGKKRRHSGSTHSSQPGVKNHPGNDDGEYVVRAHVSPPGTAALPIR